MSYFWYICFDIWHHVVVILIPSCGVFKIGFNAFYCREQPLTSSVLYRYDWLAWEFFHLMINKNSVLNGCFVKESVISITD